MNLLGTSQLHDCVHVTSEKVGHRRSGLMNEEKIYANHTAGELRLIAQGTEMNSYEKAI